MKMALRLFLVAVLLALGLWLWVVLFPSPEKIIRRRFAELARTVSVSAGESDLARLLAARNLAGFCATNVEMNLDLPRFGQVSSMDREEITQLALAASSRGGGLKVQFPDLNVTVAPDRQSAVVDLTVTAVIPGESDSLVQEMKITLHKIDGQWLVTRVETIRTLSRLRLMVPSL
jgi:hypothetical protein